MFDNQRIKKVIDYLIKEKIVYNQRDFAEKISENQSVLSEIVNGKRTVTKRFINKITDSFAFVSKDWLMNGTGDMIREEINEQEKPNGEIITGINRELFEVIKSQQEAILSQSKTIEALAKKLNEM
ncbi:MAG: hypothetical protein ACOX5K_06105 [Bacteroidales bacterium]|jgi:plasmid maintenance system antidote protein VapI|nr:helix-turn-helix transcriptional regulator [Bacteroidota bacterium]